MKADIVQFSYWHPTLRTIGLWIESETGAEFTITSPHRIGDHGVHGQLPLRAFDLRCRLKTMGEAVADHINNNWLYDPIRPELNVAVLHGAGANLHLHIQVHHNTKRLIK